MFQDVSAMGEDVGIVSGIRAVADGPSRTKTVIVPKALKPIMTDHTVMDRDPKRDLRTM